MKEYTLTRCLQATYDALPTHDGDTLYYCRDTGNVYLGSKLLSDDDKVHISGTEEVVGIKTFINGLVTTSLTLASGDDGNVFFSLDSDTNDVIVNIENDNGNDVVMRGIRPPKEDNDAANKGYVDERTADMSDKADKVEGATSGNFAGLDASGNLIDSGKKVSDFATAAQGAKADTAVQSVTVGATTTGDPGTKAEVINSGTAQAPVLEFTIPRGADAVNPFKGWWPSSAALIAAIQATAGDYAYVIPAVATDPVEIWEYDSTASSNNYWHNSGRTFNPANNQEFASGENLNETHIVESIADNLATDVLSAKRGMLIGQMVRGGTLKETKLTVTPIAGNLVGETGTVGTVSGWYHAEFNVHGRSFVRFLGIVNYVSTATTGYSFFDENGNFISGSKYDIDTSLSSRVLKEYVVPVPEGAYTMKTNVASADGMLNSDNFYMYVDDGMSLGEEIYGYDKIRVYSSELASYISNSSYQGVALLTRPDNATESTIVWDGNPASGSKRVGRIPTSIFASLKQTYNKITIKGHSSRIGYCMFVKKLIDTAVDLSYNTLSSGGYLCNGATFSNFLITIPAPPSGSTNQQVVEVDIPNDAVTLYVAYNNSTGNQVIPSSIRGSVIPHEDGLVDKVKDLQRHINTALTVEDIVDDLDTDDATKALSARQGKVIGDTVLTTVYPSNILNPSTIKVGRMVKRSSGAEDSNSSLSSYIYGCTDYIEYTEDGLSLNLGCTQAGVEGCGACYYDENKSYLGYAATSTGQPLELSNLSSSVKYVRFNLAPQSYIPTGENYAIYRASALPAQYSAWFEPYKSMKPAQIEDNSVTMSKIAFKVTKAGKNKLNPATILTNKAIRYTDGSVASATNYKASDFIPVSKRGLICNRVPESAGAVYMGYAVYNSSKTFIRGSAAPNQQYTYVDGDAYVRFSLRGTDNQVEEGTTVTTYEPYEEHTVIDPNVLPASSLSEEDMNLIMGNLESNKIFSGELQILLPIRFFYVKGDVLQLFYKGMVRSVDLANRYVKPTCSIGNPYRRYLEVPSSATPTNGNKDLDITIYDDNYNILGNATSVIQVVSAPTSPASEKHILCIGDSMTEGGKWVCECMRRLVGTGGTPVGKGLSNLVFVGSMSKELYGVTAHYYGKSGWGWVDFATEGRGGKTFRFYLSGTGNSVSIGNVYTNNGHSYTVTEINTIDDVETILCSTSSASNTPSPSGDNVSGTLTLSSGSGSATLNYTKTEQGSANPFWDSTNQQLSFAPYVNQYCGGTIDIVYIMLGVNTLFTYTAAQQKAYAKTFVQQLNREYPSCVVVLVAGPYPSMINMMPGYGASGNQYTNTYRVIMRLFNVYKAYKELEQELSYVKFESWSAQFDADYNYPLTQKNVNRRNSSVTEPYANNTVHPGDAGYMQFADAAYRSIVAHFCQ